ncbi:hypothetical protein HK101_006254 [Irineochytrium annulatum]|nr:hypothetical protein HK101_006254 [Irineochytrium annulatum]
MGVPFSDRDSAAIEAAWQALNARKEAKKRAEDATLQADGVGLEKAATSASVSTLVGVNEDQLFEVDVEKKEIYPVYWYGPTYDIRRGTWFMALDGVKFMPCDDNFSQPPSTSTSPQKGVDSKPDSKPAAYYKPEQRWALFGPWMNSFVVFTNGAGGWLFTDQLTSKWARALYTNLTRGENQGGTRVVRGWAEVEKLKKGTAKTAAHAAAAVAALGKEGKDSVAAGTKRRVSAPGSSTAAVAADEKEADKMQEREQAEDYGTEEQEERQIDHLVLVIHGIGQKLGERLETVNFVHDCTVLRHAIKDSARNHLAAAGSKDALKPGNKKPVLLMPENGGVQVLPVQWRQKIDFGKKKKPEAAKAAMADEEAAGDDKQRAEDQLAEIEDIQLEGVPSIRMLVSDVALDVLLYMTPKYRQEMVKHVTHEMNRIYRTYKQRNPKFNGKVSIYGHSLGSVLAFDILCNQPYGDEATPLVSASSSEGRGMSKGFSEVDLSDMLTRAIAHDKERGRKLNGLMERTEVQYDPLEFKVEKMFAIGSPVGLFLLLKGDKLRARRQSQKEFATPNVSRPAASAVYNIFHPHDPVAYRYEPLVAKAFSSRKPVQLQYNKGGLTRTIVGIADISSNIVDSSRSLFSGIYSTTSAVMSGAGYVVGMFGGGGGAAASAGAAAGGGARDRAGSGSMPSLTGDLSPAVFSSSFASLTGTSGSSVPAPAGSATSSTAAGLTATGTGGTTAALGQPGASSSAATGVGPSTASPSLTAGATVKPKSSADSLADSGAPIPTASDEEEIRRLNPSGRIDYVLQEGVLENPYLSSLSSHMTYWPDQDIAVFILKEFYPAVTQGGPAGAVAGGNAGAAVKDAGKGKDAVIKSLKEVGKDGKAVKG